MSAVRSLDHNPTPSLIGRWLISDARSQLAGRVVGNIDGAWIIETQHGDQRVVQLHEITCQWRWYSDEAAMRRALPDIQQRWASERQTPRHVGDLPIPSTTKPSRPRLVRPTDGTVARPHR